MTRVYAFTLVCDVYGWPGCLNAIARARAGMWADVLEAPAAEAAAAGWTTGHRVDLGQVIDVCPVCAAGLRAAPDPYLVLSGGAGPGHDEPTRTAR